MKDDTQLCDGIHVHALTLSALHPQRPPSNLKKCLYLFSTYFAVYVLVLIIPDLYSRDTDLFLVLLSSTFLCSLVPFLSSLCPVICRNYQVFGVHVTRDHQDSRLNKPDKVEQNVLESTVVVATRSEVQHAVWFYSCEHP